MQYTFITEDGEQKLELKEYHTKKSLMAQIGGFGATPKGRQVIFMGTTIISYPDELLEADAKKRATFEDIRNIVEENRLKYFVPQDETCRMFLNDTEHDLKGIVAGNGWGKAQPLTTRIPTPTGWKLMGDLKVGDEVFGGDGERAKITGVFDRGLLDTYRIEFDRGYSSVLASGDHLWKYLRHKRAYRDKDSHNKNFGRHEVLTTKQIRGIQGFNASPRKRGWTPANGAARYVAKELPIKPYTMGALLGDGSLSGYISLTTADSDIALRVGQEVSSLGCSIKKSKNKYGYRIVGTTTKLLYVKSRSGRLYQAWYRENKLLDAIRAIGLEGKNSYTKFIPEAYMLSSVSDRMDLLRGLLDTDGCYSKGKTEFSSCSQIMADQVRELVYSLGGKARVTSRYTKDQRGTSVLSYRVYILMWENPFYLPRKASKWRRSACRQDRSVCKIENVGKMPCRCISVDSNDHTYLTTDYHVTHNSTAGWIDVLLDVIPCDPSWPIFTQSGVKFRKYGGAMDMGGVGIVSYELRNHETTLWPQIIKVWTPRKYIEDHYYGKEVITWLKTPRITIAGTPCYFMTSSQSQGGAFESQALNIIWWDEQGQESKFNGANERVRRRRGRHVFSLTPHYIEGRPDTGSGSWIHKIYSGERTYGLKPKFYTASIFDLPDWVYSEEGKAAAYKQWVTEPSNNSDIKKLREGRSRLYGEFHQAHGLVFDEWDRKKHVIDDFVLKPDHTLYRTIDHGRVDPTACLMAAVTANGDIVIYDEYYQGDKVISDNARAIVEKCGNRVEPAGKFPVTPNVFDQRWIEIENKKFRQSVLDQKSFSKRGDNGWLTIGQLYNLYGLRCSPTDGTRIEKCLPIVKEYLKIDPTRKHIITGELGAPRLYVHSRCKNFIREIENYENEYRNKRTKDGYSVAIERPKDGNDHCMVCLMFLCMLKPSYYGDYGYKVKRERAPVDAYTGY